ncbi:hypothetical protein PIB30_058224 [Stylosanthes scabra]|uniref:Uncharacterized protein n=1 Tax=Stylosanthes scabra TaxID=79078 RepID=A0ABU6TL78_9FABA|nr:hypothetical protein [Stylosanthes scabra]
MAWPRARVEKGLIWRLYHIFLILVDSSLFVGHLFVALFFDNLGLGGWPVTLPPLGSSRLLGQACELQPIFRAFSGWFCGFPVTYACKAGSAFLSSGCYVFLCGPSVESGRFFFLS